MPVLVSKVSPQSPVRVNMNIHTMYMYMYMYKKEGI